MAAVIGESGFDAQAGPITVSGYSGVCFEIKEDTVEPSVPAREFNLCRLANTGFRDAQY